MSSEVVILKGAKAREYLAQHAVSKQAEMTIDRGVSDWCSWLVKNSTTITRFGYSNWVRRWVVGVQGMGITKVGPEHLRDWVNQGKLKTREFRLAVLRSLFSYLSARNLVGQNPSLLVTIDHSSMTHEQKETRVAKIFSQEDFDRLIAFLDSEIESWNIRLKLAYATLHIAKLEHRRQKFEFWKWASIISRCTGLRMGDIATMERQALCADPFVWWTRKRHKRVVPVVLMASRFKQVVEWASKRTGDHVFPVQRERYLIPEKATAMSAEFSTICRRAGLDGYTFHAHRHGYARDCLSRGLSVPHIQASLGHSSPQMTSLYLE